MSHIHHLHDKLQFLAAEQVLLHHFTPGKALLWKLWRNRNPENRQSINPD